MNYPTYIKIYKMANEKKQLRRAEKREQERLERIRLAEECEGIMKKLWESEGVMQILMIS